jgi:precorrin isomerase
MSAAALSMGAVDVAVRKLAEPSIVARASELARSLGRYGGTHAAADAVNRLVQSASEATRAS